MIPSTQDPDAPADVLVVDLDGTLIQTDMLYESFWAGAAQDWRVPLVAAQSLLGGKAALKSRLARYGALSPETLPYNAEVLAFIEAWRAKGGRVLLVTATNRAIADRIADHLGVFDEVHGTEEGKNLKGPAKAAFLEERFGKGGYTYMGDAPADMPVWAGAERAVTVGASPGLRAKVDTLGPPAEHLSPSARTVMPYLRAIRPHQWLKNTLVFLPIAAAHTTDPSAFFAACLAFISFSLVASSVYLINDLLDLAADRAHPRKRNRAIASGSIPLSHATALAPLLFLAGLLIAIPLGSLFVLVLLSYFALTLAYSLRLKRHTIIDICTLAVLYTLRIVAGGAATGIPLSVWLLAFSMFFFFSLAAVKRQAELVDGAASGKVTAYGRGYRVDDLPLVAMMAMASGYISVLVMALYLNAPAVTTLYTRPEILWIICLVLLYWISRTVLITHRGGMDDDPVVFAVKDRVSQICFLLIGAAAIGGSLL